MRGSRRWGRFVCAALFLLALLAGACSRDFASLPLTAEERSEDYRYLYDIILHNYPYLELSQRITGLDWSSLALESYEAVDDLESDEEFAALVSRVLRVLANSHTGIVSGGFISQFNSVFRMRRWREEARKTTVERADYWYSAARGASGQGRFVEPLCLVYTSGQYVLVDISPEVRSLIDAPPDDPPPESTDDPPDAPPLESTNGPSDAPPPESTNGPSDAPPLESTNGPSDAPPPESLNGPSDVLPMGSVDASLGDSAMTPTDMLLGSTLVSLGRVETRDISHVLLGHTALRFDPLRGILFEPMMTGFSLFGSTPDDHDPGPALVEVCLKTPGGETIDLEVPSVVQPWIPSYAWPPDYLSGEEVALSPTRNLYAVTLKDREEVGYAQILRMLSKAGDIRRDMNTLRQFLTDHPALEVLILDVRGNGGGSDAYWQSLVAMLASEPVTASFGVTWRQGDFVESFMEDKGAHKLPLVDEATLSEAQFGYGFPQEILSDTFVPTRAFVRTVSPTAGFSFSGEVLLLVDGGVYSSTESFAAFAARSGWATLVGAYTGGDGIGHDPVIVILPNSGMAVRFASDMGLNPDWSANEENHTRPDVLVEWQPEDILRYSQMRGRLPRPDPSVDPQLRTCLDVLGQLD